MINFKRKEEGREAPTLLKFLTPLKFKSKESKLKIEFELNKVFAMLLHSSLLVRLIAPPKGGRKFYYAFLIFLPLLFFRSKLVSDENSRYNL